MGKRLALAVTAVSLVISFTFLAKQLQLKGQ